MARGKKRLPFEFDWVADKAWRTVYAPVTAELGYAVVAWNRMHDNLGLLFTQILGLKKGSQFMAAVDMWHASDNDRIMRDLAQAAANQRSGSLGEEILEDIKWLLSAAKDLASDRNTAVHGLFHIEQQPDGSYKVLPDHSTGHPKAVRLKAVANLADEFKSYGDCATLLSHFAEMLANHLWKPKDFPLHEKPQLPPKWQKVTQAEQRQKKADKLRQRQQQSAGARVGHGKKKGADS